MSNLGSIERARLLVAVRLLHTAIFLVMAASVFYILYSGIVGASGRLFNIALCLLSVEGLVFFCNGAHCPLTGWAQTLGASKGYVFDTFFPEKWTRYTFPVFTSLLALGLVLWALHQR